MNWCVINKDSNVVVNVVLWDGKASWSPPEGTFVVQTDEASIGWAYNPQDQKFAPAKDE